MSVLAERPTIKQAPEADAVMPAIRTADANRLLYAEAADGYDSSEHCIAQAGVRRLLEELLDRAIAASGSPSPRALDACGGTGNVSELLARRGVATTLVDVSPQMLALWRAKAARIGARGGDRRE